jgi:tetratricopeptide (TPR) repeat protein
MNNEKWKKEIAQKALMRKEKDQDDYLRICIYSKETGEDSIAVNHAILLGKAFPEKADYQLELAEYYFKKQRYDLSLKLVSAYVEGHPADLSARSNKGMLLEILGKKKEALTIYEEILKVNPNEAHTRELYQKLKAKR